MLKLDARSCRSTYLVFLAMFGMLVVLGLAMGLTRHDWEAFWISLVVLSFSLLWVASFRLRIDGGELTYRSLFEGTRSIAISEIEMAEATVGIKDPFGPFHRLTVYPSKKSNAQPIVINLKVFSREDLKQLFHILADKLK